MPSVRRFRLRSILPVFTSRSFAATFRCHPRAGEGIREHVARFKAIEAKEARSGSNWRLGWTKKSNSTARWS